MNQQKVKKETDLFFKETGIKHRGVRRRLFSTVSNFWICKTTR